MAVGAHVFDVVVEGADAATFVAAIDCARIGLRVAVIPGPVPEPFVPEHFSNHGGIIADLCDELAVRYTVSDVPVSELVIAGVPANPFSPAVRAAVGWPGAWRIYADRLMPLLAIGNEENFGALVTKRLGKRVVGKLVAPWLRRELGIESLDIPAVEVAPGLSQATSRVGSLTAGVLELVADDPRWAQELTVDSGTQVLLERLRERMAYFAVQFPSEKVIPKLTSTVTITSAHASPEAPSWERAILRARESAAQARAVVLSDPDKPPVGPIDLAR